jgi:hypothetical protein
MRSNGSQTRIDCQQLFQDILGQDVKGIRMDMMQMMNPKRPSETNAQGRSGRLGDMTMQDEWCVWQSSHVSYKVAQSMPLGRAVD